MSAVASTRYGKVEGEEQSGLAVFKGIPFAAPPVGARRWMAPEKPDSWSGTREARRFGGVAPQLPMLLNALAAMVIDEPQSEDCLYLNVWTPGVDTRKRPVMVWIHGGAFAIGSGSQALYNGSILARRGDVVVVTVNYRFGPAGLPAPRRYHQWKNSRRRQRGDSRSDRGARMGARQHRGVRRRSRQCHHLRRICRWNERRHAARRTARARPVS